MARYSAISLLDKILILTTSLRSSALSSPINNLPSLTTLVAIRALNRRCRETTFFTVAYFLASNHRSVSDKKLGQMLSAFHSAGYVEFRGLNGRRIYITELGKAALNEFETKLRTSRFRTTKRDNNTLTASPGLKKGCAKPKQFLKAGDSSSGSL